MAYCRKCGALIDDYAAVCPKCGTPQNGGPNNPPPAADNGGFLWGLLGCCIPIAGLILFLVWKDTKPRTAKAAGILAGLATWWAVHPPAGVAAVLLVPLIADGLLQLCTPYESGNLRRLATGLLFGYGLTVLLLTSLGWAYQWGFGFGKALLDP